MGSALFRLYSNYPLFNIKLIMLINLIHIRYIITLLTYSLITEQTTALSICSIVIDINARGRCQNCACLGSLGSTTTNSHICCSNTQGAKESKAFATVASVFALNFPNVNEL
jgi:hypothetical protein